MYCSRCGTQNKDTAKFCDSCGLDLTATTPVGALSEAQEITEIEMVRKELDEEYEIVDELGRGGMAIVFKAKEKQLDREVAIKVLPFSLAFDKEFVERFQREARTSARLEHPNIIPIYRVGKSGRVIYFVMKFLRGKPLSNILGARGSLPPAEIRKILADVARALDSDGIAIVASVVNDTERPLSSTLTNSSAFWKRCAGVFAIIFLTTSNSWRFSGFSSGGVGISSMMCL